MPKKRLPETSIERLCRIYTLLEKLSASGTVSVNSKSLEQITGISSHTIRKDISMIGTAGSTKNGYSTEALKNLISSFLLFDVPRKACIAGLSMPGLAMLENPETGKYGFDIAAGFDSNINRIEMIKTNIPLFPSYEITEKVKELSIEIAILSVPLESAESTADKLIMGGIKGIINFSPVVLAVDNKKVVVKNIYLPEELRLLSALITAGSK